MRLFTPLFYLILCLTGGSHLFAQATLTATESSGGAYATITAAGFGIEGPDASSPECAAGDNGSHASFGEHILQAADEDLGQNVFVFYSHLPEDNDRCLVFDRARTEIKGGPEGQSDPELEHAYNDTTFYRWQFRLPEDFVGASSFNHVFQSKAAGGEDSGFPILTLTPRASRVQLRHDAGEENTTGSLGTVADADLDRFKGAWVEVSVYQVHRNDGVLVFSIHDVTSGLPILLYENRNIDLWRGAQNETGLINRPKWGIYRSYNEDAGLKDETVRFANFCVSEEAESECPSVIEAGTGSAELVTGVRPLDGSTSVPLFMPLVWEPAAGATSYTVYLGTSPTELMADTSLSTTSYRPDLAAATTYYFQIASVDGEGENRSGIYSFTTLDDPDDGNWNVARGHARPEVEAGQFFELNTDLTTLQLDSVARIADTDGNNAYCFFSGPKEGDNGNYRWRHRQDEQDEVTVVLRLKPVAGENNITYVEFYGLGWRQKLRVNRSNIRFERTIDDPEIEFPEGFWTDDVFRTLRFTFRNNDTEGEPMLTTVYLEEDETAFAGPLASDEEKSSSYVDIGRAGSTDYGACFDYMAVNTSGAYAPGDGPEARLPTDLAGDKAVAVANALPLDGSVDVPLYMPIVWDAAAGAAGYNVYLGTAEDALTLDTTVTATSYVPSLAASTTYYYRIGSANMQGEALGDIRQFTTLATPGDGDWEVARGHARPEVEAPQFFEFDTDLEMVGLDSVAPIAGDGGNNAYCWFSGPKEDDNNNYRWRYRQDEGEETTLLLRLRALPGENNIAYIEFYGLGWRQKLRVNRSTIKFERTPDDPEVEFEEGFWDDGAFHVLRITYMDNPEAGLSMLTTVYLDEETTAFASYPSDEDSDNTYLDIGRAGGTDYGACIDYIAINPTGAYAPGSGADLAPPADLVLPAGSVSTRYFSAAAPRIFPNPTSGTLRVADLAAGQQYRYRVLSVSGQQLLSGTFASTSGEIDVTRIPAGIYFLELRSAQGGRGVTRFVRR